MVNTKDKKMTISERIILLLNKSLTWTILGVLATIIVPFVVMYCQINDTKSTNVNSNVEAQLLNSIKEKINYIEEEIHPEKYNCDSTHASYVPICLIKEFNISSLNYASYLEDLLFGRELSSLNNVDTEELTEAFLSYIDNIFELSDNMENIFNCVSNLDEYGRKNGISMLIVNKAKILSVENDYNEAFQKLLETNKKNIDRNNRALDKNKENTLESIKIMEKNVKNMEMYNCYNSILELIISQNRLYINYFRSITVS